MSYFPTALIFQVLNGNRSSNSTPNIGQHHADYRNSSQAAELERGRAATRAWLDIHNLIREAKESGEPVVTVCMSNADHDIVPALVKSFTEEGFDVYTENSGDELHPIAFRVRLKGDFE